ncbi:MAG: M20/M25/M40 family metallo-hydrolase [Candidatus Magasanikbacteria bacterium]|nr:M20/M25/M40 family metallo-hydrolase [Candidatus Magasanikbacteria bacterium]
MLLTSIDSASIESQRGLSAPTSIGQETILRLLEENIEEALKGKRNGLAIPAIKRLSDKSLLAQFPAAPGCENAPAVCFAAHVDTHPDCVGKANPIIHDYQGGDLKLPCQGIVIPASDLQRFVGGRIITGDGTSLLGGDDKTGVAALITVIETLVSQPDFPHGRLDFWFAVDEEIGGMISDILPEEVVHNWSILWTADGGEVGLIDIATMCGGFLKVEFKGVNAHPGDEGYNLKPAHYAAAELVAKIGELPSPWNTSGLESFFYATNIEEGKADSCRVLFHPRSFERAEIQKMAAEIKNLAQAAARQYGVAVTIKDEGVIYTDTGPAIEARKYLLSPVISAHREAGFEPHFQTVRAGTDGSTLNLKYPRLPAPNLGVGAFRIHSQYEFVVARQLEALPRIILKMIEGYALMAALPELG